MTGRLPGRRVRSPIAPRARRSGRPRLRVALLGAALAALCSCTIGAPPGFSDGDSWIIPLVGPLENGLLLVPALVNDKGPFVFAIDPDAHVSIVDQEVVKLADARTGEGPRMLDESDTQHPRFYAEILAWQLGTLTVKQKPAQVVAIGTFDADGRRIHGVIGRDIIADSIVFHFDRDLGVATLSTQRAARIPPGAVAIRFSKLHSQIDNVEVVPVPRRLATAVIGGERFVVHLDLGATASQLRARSWDKAKLVAAPLTGAVVDEVGVRRAIATQGLAESVAIGAVAARHVAFVPYGDRRWSDQDLEGTLGLGFFEPYAVVANWDRETFYLAPRAADDRTRAERVAARIARWQSRTLSGCREAGCVRVALIDPIAGKAEGERPAKHPGLVATFAREPSASALDLEVLVAVTPAPGRELLPWLIANLPAGTERAMTHLPESYVGAALAVVDASPFPRACPSDGACVDRLPQR